MFQTTISPATLTVKTVPGFPFAINGLAQNNLSGHNFLRAAWYEAGAPEGGRTVVVRRDDGTLVAAIPTCAFGPNVLGTRKVPGSYWPFRGALLATDANPLELADALGSRNAAQFGPLWRMGPVKAEDPATRMLIAGAQAAGWHVLSQPAGTIWVIDLAAARSAGWPQRSTAKRLGRLERRLDTLGAVAWRHVRGRDWDESALDQMAEVERNSWIAAETDGSGAKFMAPHQRAVWRMALADPVLAEMLCATILLIDGRAVSFSLDMDDGPVQYSIAGSYVSDLGKYDVGKLVTYRIMADAIADGQSLLDMGAGDGGYKQVMGAAPAYELVDLLFVRNFVAANLLRGWWSRQGA